MDLFVSWSSFLSWRALTENAINERPLSEHIDLLLIETGFFTREITEEGDPKFEHAKQRLTEEGVLRHGEKLRYVLYGIVFKKIFKA